MLFELLHSYKAMLRAPFGCCSNSDSLTNRSDVLIRMLFKLGDWEKWEVSAAPGQGRRKWPIRV